MLAAAACAAAFAAVLILTPRVPAAGTADADTVRALTRLAGSWVGSLASIIAHSDEVMIPILLVAVLGWGAAAGRRRETVAAAALVGVAMAGAEVLKLALDQP